VAAVNERTGASRAAFGRSAKPAAASVITPKGEHEPHGPAALSHEV
jgi:hypothetical protein